MKKMLLIMSLSIVANMGHNLFAADSKESTVSVTEKSQVRGSNVAAIVKKFESPQTGVETSQVDWKDALEDDFVNKWAVDKRSTRLIIKEVAPSAASNSSSSQLYNVQLSEYGSNPIGKQMSEDDFYANAYLFINKSSSFDLGDITNPKTLYCILDNILRATRIDDRYLKIHIARSNMTYGMFNEFAPYMCFKECNICDHDNNMLVSTFSCDQSRGELILKGKADPETLKKMTDDNSFIRQMSLVKMQESDQGCVNAIVKCFSNGRFASNVPNLYVSHSFVNPETLNLKKWTGILINNCILENTKIAVTFKDNKLYLMGSLKNGDKSEYVICDDLISHLMENKTPCVIRKCGLSLRNALKIAEANAMYHNWEIDRCHLLESPYTFVSSLDPLIVDCLDVDNVNLLFRLSEHYKNPVELEYSEISPEAFSIKECKNISITDCRFQDTNIVVKFKKDLLSLTKGGEKLAEVIFEDNGDNYVHIYEAGMRDDVFGVLSNIVSKNNKMEPPYRVKFFVERDLFSIKFEVKSSNPNHLWPCVKSALETLSKVEVTDIDADNEYVKRELMSALSASGAQVFERRQDVTE